MIIGTRVKPKAPPVPAGTYLAICVGVYDLGEQPSEWQGKTRYRNEVQFTFEIPDEKIEIDGELKPRQLSRKFAVTASKNGNLRKFVTAWRGKAFSDEEFAGFNTDSLLGRTALIQVSLSEDGAYSNIDGVMLPPKGMPQPTTESELHKFNIDEWDDREFDALPEWVQEKIKKSTQYQQLHAPETVIDFPAQTATRSAQEEEPPF